MRKRDGHFVNFCTLTPFPVRHDLEPRNTSPKFAHLFGAENKRLKPGSAQGPH